MHQNGKIKSFFPESRFGGPKLTLASMIMEDMSSGTVKKETST